MVLFVHHSRSPAVFANGLPQLDRVAIMGFVVVDLMHCPDGEIGAKVVAQDCVHCALIFIESKKHVRALTWEGRVVARQRCSVESESFRPRWFLSATT